MTAVVADCHALAAATAHYQSLQQRGPFAGRTLAALLTLRLSVLAQAVEIPLIVLPADVALMCSGNQDFPFIFRHMHDLDCAVDGLASVAHSIDESAGV